MRNIKLSRTATAGMVVNFTSGEESKIKRIRSTSPLGGLELPCNFMPHSIPSSSTSLRHFHPFSGSYPARVSAFKLRLGK